MTRECKECYKEKPLETGFYRTGKYHRTYSHTCKQCRAKQGAIKRAAIRMLAGVAARRRAKIARDEQVINLRLKHGISMAGIARRVGITPPTVKSILARVQIME